MYECYKNVYTYLYNYCMKANIPLMFMYMRVVLKVCGNYQKSTIFAILLLLTILRLTRLPDVISD